MVFVAAQRFATPKILTIIEHSQSELFLSIFAQLEVQRRKYLPAWYYEFFFFVIVGCDPSSALLIYNYLFMAQR